MKEHQKISVTTTLHVALDNLDRLKPFSNKPTDFHEIVCDDVPVSTRTAKLRAFATMLLNVPQETFERFELSPKKETTGNKLRRERKEYAKIRRRSFVAAALAPFRCLFYSSTLWQSGHHLLHKLNPCGSSSKSFY